MEGRQAPPMGGRQDPPMEGQQAPPMGGRQDPLIADTEKISFEQLNETVRIILVF